VRLQAAQAGPSKARPDAKVYLTLSPRTEKEQAAAKEKTWDVCPGEGVYAGSMVRGVRDGSGKLWLNNGDMYEGQWRGDELHGQGRIAYQTGAVYEGDFEDGRRHGWGTLIYANGDVYEGSWNDDTKEGRGTFHWKEMGTKYDGDFFGGVMHGEGRYYFADGSMYQGSYKDGKRQGRGTLTMSDGSTHTGEWQGLARTLSKKNLLEEPPAFRPDLALKRKNATKSQLERELKMEAYVQQLEEERKGAHSPTGEPAEAWDDFTPRLW
jgi:hypothetical protein